MPVHDGDGTSPAQFESTVDAVEQLKVPLTLEFEIIYPTQWHRYHPGHCFIAALWGGRIMGIHSDGEPSG